MRAPSTLQCRFFSENSYTPRSTQKPWRQSFSLMSPFGLQLRFYRTERGVPLKRLAEELRLSEKTLSAIETGRRRPLTEEELRIVSKFLHLNTQESAALELAAADSPRYIQIPLAATPRQ